MIPFAEMEPSALRTAVPCHEEVVPLGLVFVPPKVAVCVDCPGALRLDIACPPEAFVMFLPLHVAV